MADHAPNAPSTFAYLFYQTVGLLVFTILLPPTLLYRTICHVVPSQRPYPTWSLRRDLAVAAGRLYLAWTVRFCLPRPEKKKAWKRSPLIERVVGRGTGTTVVEIPPVNDEWITGVAASGEGEVKREKVPGFWTFERGGRWTEGSEHATPAEKVIMYIAGGSWVMGHPMGTPFPYRFCTTTHQRVLSVNHRKALTPDSAFPAQLQDALAGLVYLLSLGFEAQNISLIGDSSGAHIQLALCRYLAELAQTKIVEASLPGALVLVSPSCDLSHPPSPSQATDFLVPYLNQRAIPSLVRHLPHSAMSDNAYISPGVAGTFAHLADAQSTRNLRIWIQRSTTELLAPDQEALVKKMRAEGVELEVDVVEGGSHLDAGIAFALGERGPESSWVRLLDAVRRVTA